MTWPLITAAAWTFVAAWMLCPLVAGLIGGM